MTFLLPGKGRVLSTIILTCLPCWFFAYLATHVFMDYAFGLFIWLPIVLGASSTLMLGYKNPVPASDLRRTAFLTLGVFCLGMLTFAFEGMVCIAMALPIGFLFTWVGFWIGNTLLTSRAASNTPVAMLLLFLSVPLFMGFEYEVRDAPTLRSVVTSVEIAAPPETVWNNVVEFPALPAPTEIVFKTGIAYPMSATIDGHGAGAVRHCNFSTGSFVEPITVWQEPNILRFDVQDQPEPMTEVSPYDIQPNHLHGFWVSRQGQFLITPMANGHTLLEGTTWYVNKIQPSAYWTLWSDYVVHAIHSRVLNHIKMLCERNK